MNTRLFWSIGWGLMTLMCLLFAPMAAEFYWTTVNATTATYAQLLALTVSESYAYGEGSGFAEMTPHWREMPHLNQLVLGVHAVLASVALVIGPFLFVGRIRHRWPQVHRRLGQSYVSLVVVAMILSAVYLLLTPMDRIYGGPPFAVGLWGIGFLTTYTALAGTWHILRGEQEAHRSVMILNFSAMLIAPVASLPVDGQDVQTEDGSVRLLSLVLLDADEFHYAQDHGVEALYQRLDAHHVYEKVDPDRPSVASDDA